MLIVQRLAEGWSVAAIAAAQGVTAKTVRKWRDRHVAEGEAGLVDRTSKPHHSPTRLASVAEDEIEQLRRQRLSGPAIARRLLRPLSTVGVALRRRGLGRLASFTAQMMIRPTDTFDTKPGFAGQAGVKPREATAEGGSGLTPDRSANAKSAIEGTTSLGSDS